MKEEKMLQLIKELQEDNKNQWSCINDTKKKIDEIHKVFVGSKFTGKFVVGFFAVAGVISGGIFAIIKLFSSMGR